jgi:hypothetical protein
LVNNTRPPKDGDLWRINFSRVEWDTKVVNGKYVKLKDNTGRNLPEHNWVWSPQGVVNMHYPERWGYLQFNKGNVNNTAFALPYFEEQKRYLWLIYYQEQLWYKQHGAYTSHLKSFKLNSKVTVNGHENTLQIEGTRRQFMALITDKEDEIARTINQEGLIGPLNTKKHE